MKRTHSVFVLLACMLCLFFALAGCNGGASGGDVDGADGTDGAQTYRTVMFDSRGGSAVASRRVPDGGLVARPEAPERAGYTLLGWFEDAEATAEWDFDTDRVTGDITLYAGWQEKTEKPAGEPKILVAFFSCTNRTKAVAENIYASLSGADIYRITPAVPYTPDDLNYNVDCRANREQNDPTARPEMSGSVQSIEQYDVIFIGYPIWWGQAPKIVYTFFESSGHDFDGVTIIPFCTSGSSGIGSSATNLHASAPKADWKTGARISGTDVSALIAQMNED